ncbi:GntR family transcriptional regulator [Aquibacillus halophilus]|uniref:GntR family transcriptional regulator n=1 Tax=Aquibacillus halophilus TaxID=930132 RepID=A0A6A8DNP5_9BACI|nr:GntR family transcriptional regulator [Aquibacillus halophilus]MRH42872.1 GntR family transcriptional regulator [Aquibacillus halophilus]
MNTKSKAYEEVLGEIRKFISKNELSSGDKLPSERELADQLNASRSSVREALRALELLGLIETRRGEGTFLKVYRPYHTVGLLSAFILQDPNVKKDIILTKNIIEKEATKIASSQLKQEDMQKLLSILENNELDEKQRHYNFFMVIFQHTENNLMQRIWQLMEDFSYTMEEIGYNKQFYIDLIEILNTNQQESIEYLFEKLSR